MPTRRAVALIVLAVTMVVAVGLRLYADPYGPQSVTNGESFVAWVLDNGPLLAGVAALTALFISLASLYRTATLSRGGAQVARMLGATEVTGEAQDPLRKRLLNVALHRGYRTRVPAPTSRPSDSLGQRTPGDASETMEPPFRRLDRHHPSRHPLVTSNS